jgi:hypothetical protein
MHERVAVLENQLADMRPKIDAMYNMMVEGRGATKLGKLGVSLLGASGVGALIVAKWHALVIWFGTP